MNHLIDIQTAFQAHLLDTHDQHIYQSIISTPKMPAEKRMGIYSYAYAARLIEALAENYPKVFIYLGEDKFYQLAQEYLHAHPSAFRSIRWFGDQLDDFLKHDSFLNEFARIEWMMSSVFDASDAGLLSIEELAQLPPENWPDMKLQAHPSVHRLDLSWNTMQIWQALDQKKSADKPIKLDTQIPWVFWRKDLVSQFNSLPPAETWAIDAILKDTNFEDICIGLTKWQDEEQVGIYAASLLKGFINAGLISKIT